jgi:chromosomal replication initiator protein
MVIYLMRETTDLSFPAIAKEVGVRDHTTVVHGWRKVAGQVGKERFA